MSAAKEQLTEALRRLGEYERLLRAELSGAQDVVAQPLRFARGGVVKQIQEGRRHFGYAERIRLERERDLLRQNLGRSEAEFVSGFNETVAGR